MAPPTTGTPKDLPSGGVVFFGQDLFLHVEADAALPASVTVKFKAVVFTTSNLTGALVEWKETLTTEPGKPLDPKSTQVATRVKWKANVNGAEARADLEFTVTDPGGTEVRARDRVLMRRFLVTALPRLTRIMQQEFGAEAKDGSTSFDPAVCNAFLASLSAQQKSLLLNYPAKSPGRLVVFITMLPESRGQLMGADYSNAAPGVVRANASFSVFHCPGVDDQDPASTMDDVTLACHTEHFVVNFKNPDTVAFTAFSKPELTDKARLAPAMYKLCLERPSTHTDGTVWSEILTPQGVNIMPGNTMHGLINTVGCWMLFRNFNWQGNSYLKMTRLLAKWMRKAGKLQDKYKRIIRPHQLGTRPPPQKKLDELAAKLDAEARVDAKFPVRLTDEVKGKLQQPLPSNFNAQGLELNQFAKSIFYGQITDVLKDAGYTEKLDDRMKSVEADTSFSKFWRWDYQKAYPWFFRDIVGIQYFATQMGNFAGDYMHDHRLGAKSVVPSLPATFKYDKKKWGDGPDGIFNYHSYDAKMVESADVNPLQREAWFDPRKRGKFSPALLAKFKDVTIGTDILGKNALGFQPITDFLPQAPQANSRPTPGPVKKADLEKCSYADLFFYRDDALPQVTRAPFLNADDLK